MPAKIPISRCLVHRVFALFVVSAGVLQLAAAPKPAPDSASVTTTLSPDSGHLVIDAKGLPAPLRLFFSATVEQSTRIDVDEITSEARVKIHRLQGKAEVLTLGLSGDGDIVDVSGQGLLDWSVRQIAAASAPGGATPKRALDLRPLPAFAVASGSPDLDLVVRMRLKKPAIPGRTSLLLVTAGEAVGFSSKLIVHTDAGIGLQMVNASGLVPFREMEANPSNERWQFVSNGEASLTVKLLPRGASPADAELLGAQLGGQLAGNSGSMNFHLRGQLHVLKAGARTRILRGNAALSETTAGDGWHIELEEFKEGGFAYDIVADREGTFAIDLPFVAAVRETGDWHTLDFSMPAGAVVPIQLEGLSPDVSFNPDSPIFPTSTAKGWQGFLPADGTAALAWKKTRGKSEGTLFFTSSELTEARLGAGLLRQTSQLSLRILQGKLGGIRCRLDGPGEIIGVDGANVVGWKVLPGDDKSGRVLEVNFSRPIETSGSLIVRSQTELGGFPVRAEPLRLAPEGVVRHSGFLRVANSGAVRLEVADATGMMQLAPAQFPGGAPESGVRQVFVYRFPSANYDYRLLASQIQPEIGVSTITTYELAETDRAINASIELDVREAALRDWSLQIPADYTVAAVTGGDVSDYVAESETADGYRTLKVLFARAIDGRQLLQLRLEKNQTASAGDWTLPALHYPGAKTVRGHIGVVATPGYRVTVAKADQLVEVPLSYFPRQTPGLQQAWRLRDANWTAALRIEALGQNIQADAFHLYSVKQGVMYGSVLLNYFVVGAPANEWRIEVPASVGNIDVVGQNVRRDWRREGNQVIVSLHQPVLGAATLLVTFEQPMSARGGTITPGEVRPLGVQSERGYIEVVSPLQVKHEIKNAEGGLLRLEPLELPPEFRLLTTSPALAVYQYTARPFKLEIGLDWYTTGETVDQIVDFAKLSSQVSRDGQVVTDVRYFVKTRGQKALRLVIPAGVKLWEARVDGEMTNARLDGDQTIIPLPARLNANEPVSVTLRLGQAAGSQDGKVKLIAPRTIAPTVIDEWTLHSDAGYLLVPRGGNAQEIHPALRETGFEWVTLRRRAPMAVLLGLAVLSAIFLRTAYGWKVGAGLFCGAAAMCAALINARDAVNLQRPNLPELTYAATMVPAGENVVIEFANLRDWRAMIVSWGLVVAAVGGSALIATMLLPSWRRGRLAKAAVPVAVIALSVGLLVQHGGAVYFYEAAANLIFLFLLYPIFRQWKHDRAALPPTIPPAAAGSTGAAALAPLLALIGIFALSGGSATKLHATEHSAPATAWLQDGAKSAQAIIQTWTIREKRLYAELDVTVRGSVNDGFLLLKAPAVLTGFKGDGLRVNKVERAGQTVYYLTADRDGLLTARVRFEMPVPDRDAGIELPTGPAATQRVTIQLDQSGWEFLSPTAMQILPTPGLDENSSGATLVLAPGNNAMIKLRARQRDITSEKIQYFSEAANLYVPGPGVVNGYARITARPVQGRISEMDLDVPPGLTVGDVSRGPVGAWRFDPVKRRLHVAIEPAQTETFKFDVETQLGTGALPFALSLEPIHVAGANSEVGTVALAFGGDAQPEAVKATGFSPINPQDFDASLIPTARDGRALATVQQVWRYGQGGGRVDLKITAVAPEVRVSGRQILSLDDDRLVMGVDLNVAITRVGLFSLSFALPDGLEVEALSGAALSQWTETREGNARIVTMHLNGRTIGEQTFALSLAGAAPHAQAAWPVPRVIIREATRQTGEVLIVPGRGLRLRPVDRERVTQVDPRAIGGLQPGTLAFDLLQENWVLTIGIEALEPWVTVQALQEMTLREGQTLTRIALRYRVESAAVKQVRVKLPGLNGDNARTVRATGSAVSDIVAVPGSPDLWEIHFQRGIAGETDVQIEFQTTATRSQDREAIAPPEFPGARQVVQFVAVRTGGRLELDTDGAKRGWTRTDWSAVPANLQDRSDRSIPALCFRVAEPEGALTVAVRRHEVAESLKLRVTQGDLTTLFSTRGTSLTAVELKIDVLEKSTLNVRLPDGAVLYNSFVNGTSMPVVRDGNAYLFHVSPNTGPVSTAVVRLVYATTQTGRKDAVGLMGPSLSIPLENVTWRVVIPPGYDLKDYEGGLRLREESAGGSFRIQDYQSLVASKRSSNAQEAVALLQQASVWLQKGDQQKASEVLTRVSNAPSLDEASNEDARVQLRNLKTQQTVLGLNTRRQKLYLDNRVDGARNEQLEQAATLNPLMQNKLNFNPQDMDQLLMGNTAEENVALKGIAARLVDQQLDNEPAPAAIDVTLAENGRVLTFKRSLQVDGTAPLELHLEVAQIARVNLRIALALLVAIASIALIPLMRVGEGRS